MSTEYIRPDGRHVDQMRDLKIEVGTLDRADGSALVHLGRNIVMASVFGPRELHPKHFSDATKAVVRISYRMATFSVDDYKRPFPSRREKEISKVLSDAFNAIVLTHYFPRSAIDVHVEMLQSDGGSRTAASIAASAALADAGIPMRDLIGGIATGLYEDHICLDLNGIEDMKGTGDMPILYAPNTQEVCLFQLDGMFTFEEFNSAFDRSVSTIEHIVEEIQNALKKRYLSIRQEIVLDEEDEDVDTEQFSDPAEQEPMEIVTEEDDEPVAAEETAESELMTEDTTAMESEVEPIVEVVETDEPTAEQQPEPVVEDVHPDEPAEMLSLQEEMYPEEAKPLPAAESEAMPPISPEESSRPTNWFDRPSGLPPMQPRDEQKEEEN